MLSICLSIHCSKSLRDASSLMSQGNPNWSACPGFSVCATFSSLVTVICSARTNDGRPMLQFSGEVVTIWEQFAVSMPAVEQSPDSNLLAGQQLGYYPVSRLFWIPLNFRD